MKNCKIFSLDQSNIKMFNKFKENEKKKKYLLQILL